MPNEPDDDELEKQFLAQQAAQSEETETTYEEDQWIKKTFEPDLNLNFIKTKKIHTSDWSMRAQRVDLVYLVATRDGDPTYTCRNPFKLVSVPAPLAMRSTLLRSLRYEVRSKLREIYLLAEFSHYLTSVDGVNWELEFEIPKDSESGDPFLCL
jgi:hypothetical protein